MGLDYAELCIACEEEFGTRIELVEMTSARTVGDLYHHILKMLERDDKRRCPYAAMFFSLRKALIRHGKCRSHRGIRPGSSMNDLLPTWGRRRAWRKVQQASSLELPSLREGSIFLACVVIGIPLGIASTVILSVALDNLFPGSAVAEGAYVLGGLLLVFMVPIATAIILRRWAPAWIPSAWTVDALVKKAVDTRYVMLSREGKLWDSASVWRSLQAVITDRFGVPSETITPDALLLEDLRIGD